MKALQEFLRPEFLNRVVELLLQWYGEKEEF